MQKFEIGKNEAGQRFDKYLHKILKEATSSFIYKMLRKKNITLNGKKAEGNEILSLNDEVQMFFSEATFLKFSGKTIALTKTTDGDVFKEYEKAFQSLKGISVIYEDQDVCILHKPLNILSQKDTPDSLSANEWLIGYLLDKKELTKEDLISFKPSVVNRLDRNTTGLLICGKSLFGLQKMSECVRNRTIDKYYVTVCLGKFTKAKEFDGYLWKEENTNKVTFFQNLSEVPEEIQKSEQFSGVKTGFYPVAYEGELSLVAVLLYTGKTHQIRAHLSSLGFPILGDPKYGSRKMNQKYREKEQLLHAYCLKIPELEGLEISGKTLIDPFPDTFLKYFPGGEALVNLGN